MTSPELPEPSTESAVSRRRLLGLLGIAAAVLGLLLELGQAGSQGRPVVEFLVLAGERVFTIALAAMPALGVLLACIGIGLFWIRAAAWSALFPLERGLLAFAAGAGTLSIVSLLLGIAGIFSRPPAAGAVVAAGLIGGLLRLRALIRTVQAPGESLLSASNDKAGSSRVWITLSSLSLGLAALLLIAGALSPPLVYDVTEYHLGAFADYAAAPNGWRIHPIPHNFYARFPFPVESLYYLGLLLENGRDFSPKLLNAAFVVAGALLVLAYCGRAGVRKEWGLLAAALVLAHPVVLEVGLDAYIDAAVAFLMAAALFALLLAIGWGRESGVPAVSPGRGEPASLLEPSLLPLAAFLLGLAVISKYTVAQLYLLPTILIMGGPLLGQLRRGSFRPSGVPLLISALALLLPVSVWLGKNLFFYGNPLEPFFAWVFHSGDPEAIARERFYIESHYPQPFWSLGYWDHLPRRLGAFWWPILAPLLLIPLLPRNSAWPLRRLILWAAGVYLLWNLIRESQARFLLPAVLVLISLSGSVIQGLPERWSRGAVASILLALAWTGLGIQSIKLASGGIFNYLGQMELSPPPRKPGEPPDPRARFYEKNLGVLGRLMSDLPGVLPEKSRLLMVYEARPYLFRSYQPVYNTVWDDSPLVAAARGSSSVADLSSRLRAQGITHLLVNEEELRRFIEQYARKAQLNRLGVLERDRFRAYFATPTPQDLYPPFWRSPHWNATRSIILDFLRQARRKAVAVQPVERAGIGKLELWVAPLP